MKQLTLVFLFMCFITCLIARTPGIVVKPEGTAGPMVLQSDSIGHSSQSTRGFYYSDITYSEFSYKIMLTVASEPCYNLLRGSSDSFSNIFKDFTASRNTTFKITNYKNHQF